jgi:hypothetical protein
MRDRQQPRSNPQSPRAQTLSEVYSPGAPVSRVFAPSDLDLDALAESIRLLLGDDYGPRIPAHDPPDSDLRSLPHRGSHVVEANEQPQWP